MRYCLKALLVAAMVLMAVIPGAYGVVDIHVSGGNAGSGESVQYGFVTDINSEVEASVNVDQAKLHEGPIIIDGTFSKFLHNHQITDGVSTAGVHAEVINGDYLEYDDNVGAESGVVYAEQKLTAHADSIKCSQSASNSYEGDEGIYEGQASSDIKITDGTLTNYQGYAWASVGGLPIAMTGQSFDLATGKEIIVNEKASTTYMPMEPMELSTSTKTTTKVYGTDGVSGVLANYDGISYATPIFNVAGKTFDSAEGVKIVTEDTASARMVSEDGSVSDGTAKSSIITTDGRMRMQYGEMLDPMFGFPVSTIAAAGEGLPYTFVGGNLVEANGAQINLDASILRDGNSANVKAKVVNGDVQGVNFAEVNYDGILALQDFAVNLGPDVTKSKSVNLAASAQSISGSHDSDTAKALDPSGFQNVAGVYYDYGSYSWDGAFVYQWV